MKISLFIAINFCVAFSIVSCHKQSPFAVTEQSIIQDSTEVYVDSCKSLYSNFTLCFDSLLLESRCPYGAVCVWSGYALARFKLSNGLQQHFFKLATDTVMGYKNDTTVMGVNIRLAELTPHPATTILYPYSAYKAKIIYSY